MTTIPVVVDANVVVALVDARDKWHHQAVRLRDEILAVDASLVYFDLVVGESVSVLGRRSEEQRRSEQFAELLDRLAAAVPADAITWISASMQGWHQQVLDLCRASGGSLNYNDCLIALACRELGIRRLLSFDADFDQIAWLQRLTDPSSVQTLLQS